MKLGRLNWQADSYHIYGKDIEEAGSACSTGLRARSSRTGCSVVRRDDREMYEEAGPEVEEKIRKYDASHPED